MLLLLPLGRLATLLRVGRLLGPLAIACSGRPIGPLLRLLLLNIALRCLLRLRLLILTARGRAARRLLDGCSALELVGFNHFFGDNIY